jgi:uncharacterized membrane protein
MDRRSAAQVIAILCSGLMAGLLFGDWLGTSFARARMSDASFIELQQIVHVNYLRTLPALSSAAVLAPIVWLFMWRSRRGRAEFGLLLAATIALVIGQAITFLINVPINDQLEGWSAANPPSNARQIWSRWETAHIVRTVFWAAGFLLEIIALVVGLRRSAASAFTADRDVQTSPLSSY